MGYVMGGLIFAFSCGVCCLSYSPCLAPLFFWGLSCFWGGLFCSGAVFFPFLGGGWWPFFFSVFFHFLGGGGAFFWPFYYNKRWGGVVGPSFGPFVLGPSLSLYFQLKTGSQLKPKQKTRPKKQGSEKRTHQKKGPRTPPPLPKKIRLPGPFFGGPIFGPLFGVPLALFWPVLGVFWGDFFSALFSLHNKN